MNQEKIQNSPQSPLPRYLQESDLHDFFLKEDILGKHNSVEMSNQFISKEFLKTQEIYQNQENQTVDETYVKNKIILENQRGSYSGKIKKLVNQLSPTNIMILEEQQTNTINMKPTQKSRKGQKSYQNCSDNSPTLSQLRHSKKLEVNKKAAKDSRKRKKVYVQILETRIQELEQQIQDIKNEDIKSYPILLNFSNQKNFKDSFLQACSQSIDNQDIKNMKNTMFQNLKRIHMPYFLQPFMMGTKNVFTSQLCYLKNKIKQKIEMIDKHWIEITQQIQQIDINIKDIITHIQENQSQTDWSELQLNLQKDYKEIPSQISQQQQEISLEDYFSNINGKAKKQIKLSYAQNDSDEELIQNQTIKQDKKYEL